MVNRVRLFAVFTVLTLAVSAVTAQVNTITNGTFSQGKAGWNTSGTQITSHYSTSSRVVDGRIICSSYADEFDNRIGGAWARQTVQLDTLDLLLVGDMSTGHIHGLGDAHTFKGLELVYLASNGAVLCETSHTRIPSEGIHLLTDCDATPEAVTQVIINLAADATSFPPFFACGGSVTADNLELLPAQGYPLSGSVLSGVFDKQTNFSLAGIPTAVSARTKQDRVEIAPVLP